MDKLVQCEDFIFSSVVLTLNFDLSTANSKIQPTTSEPTPSVIKDKPHLFHNLLLDSRKHKFGFNQPICKKNVNCEVTQLKPCF